MELLALDEDFQAVGLAKLKYFDLTWYRKYYATGTFSVQVRRADYSENMKYVYSKDRPELGVVQKVVYTEEDGMVVLSGAFYEGMLADKVIYPAFRKHGSRTGYVLDAVERYKGDIPKLQVRGADAGGEPVEKEEEGTTLEDMAHSTLQVEEMAYRCVYDFEEDVIWFEVYQGKDRTQAQTEENFVTFSKGFRNIRGVKVQNDSSGYKNYFIIAGGEGETKVFETLDQSGGGYRHEAYVDARTRKYDPKKQTEQEYRSALIQYAKERASKYANVENVEFDALADAGARYLEDYDLGDKCDVVIEEIGKSYEARIIEILETWTRGEHRVTLVFGDRIPTNYERERMKG